MAGVWQVCGRSRLRTQRENSRNVHILHGYEKCVAGVGQGVGSGICQVGMRIKGGSQNDEAIKQGRKGRCQNSKYRMHRIPCL